MKQDRNGVRTAADLERKYNFANIEKATRMAGEGLVKVNNEMNQLAEVVQGNMDKVMSEMAAIGVSGIDVEYYSSTSPFVLNGGEWQGESPKWESGRYIWSRTVTTYKDGTVAETEPACITGNDGEKGEDAILLMIESSNGNIFKNSGVATTLTVTIIYGDQMVTDSKKMAAIFGSNAYLQWQYKIQGSTEFVDIPLDDLRLSDNGFIFTLNVTDVEVKTVFNCNLYF